MPEFSGSKIIKHKFQVDNEDINANMGYNMIIRCDLQAKNDAKYRLLSVRILHFWYLVHVESDMCIEVKKDTTD